MKNIRIGLIGASGRAILAKHWHPPHSAVSEVVAAADVAERSLADLRAWAPDAATMTDYRELLAHPDLDAVAVFTPDRFHEEHALAVLAAGKALYLEKPMALSTEACDRILAARRKAGTPLMMGFNLRYHPVVLAAREAIGAGRIGAVKAIWVRHFIGAGGDFYYHDWHANRTGVHSLLLQKASHDFDVIHWLGGAYGTRAAAFGDLDYFGGSHADDLTCQPCPDRAACREEQAPDNPRQQCVFRRSVDVEDNQVVILQLANGVKASYAQCHFTPEYLRNYTLIGTDGRIEFNLERNEIWLYPRPAKTRDWPTPPPREAIPLAGAKAGDEGHGGADEQIAAGFLRYLREGVPPNTSPEDGRMSVAVGCAATASLREGRVMDVPPLPS
ncbi:MAG TPA: Gfo/Idh/MocA family oxidoreductase [Kiritimatiellia bacterium]|nr:Gfo/Idh/MocA family oxidoreductase [Kiritimatiellia bacterium]